MTYKEYPGEKTYVVFHTEGTGEQGGSPIVEKEILRSFDTNEEALEFGKDRYPRITGWEWDNFTININTLTEKGKEKYAEFVEDYRRIEAHAKANPHLYHTYEMANGNSITLRHNEAFDGPLKRKDNE